MSAYPMSDDVRRMQDAMTILEHMMPGWELWAENTGRGFCVWGKYLRRTDDAELMAAALEPRAILHADNVDTLTKLICAYTAGIMFQQRLGVQP